MTTSIDNRGQWQAQGNDIGGDGHCHPWNELSAPSKDDAHAHLTTVEQMCTREQCTIRAVALSKARRYIARAPAEGIHAFHMKTFKVVGAPTRARRARVDLEITTGAALVG